MPWLLESHWSIVIVVGTVWQCHIMSANFPPTDITATMTVVRVGSSFQQLLIVCAHDVVAEGHGEFLEFLFLQLSREKLNVCRGSLLAGVFRVTIPTRSR